MDFHGQLHQSRSVMKLSFWLCVPLLMLSSACVNRNPVGKAVYAQDVQAQFVTRVKEKSPAVAFALFSYSGWTGHAGHYMFMRGENSVEFIFYPEGTKVEKRKSLPLDAAWHQFEGAVLSYTSQISENYNSGAFDGTQFEFVRMSKGEVKQRIVMNNPDLAKGSFYAKLVATITDFVKSQK